MKPTTVTLSSSSPRYAAWLEVFGTDTVEVTSPAPRRINVLGESRHAYFLHLTTLSEDQRRRLVSHISRNFGLSPAEASAELELRGCPVLVEDTVCAFDARLVS